MEKQARYKWFWPNCVTFVHTYMYSSQWCEHIIASPQMKTSCIRCTLWNLFVLVRKKIKCEWRTQWVAQELRNNNNYTYLYVLVCQSYNCMYVYVTFLCVEHYLYVRNWVSLFQQLWCTFAIYMYIRSSSQNRMMLLLTSSPPVMTLWKCTSVWLANHSTSLQSKLKLKLWNNSSSSRRRKWDCSNAGFDCVLLTHLTCVASLCDLFFFFCVIL